MHLNNALLSLCREHMEPISLLVIRIRNRTCSSLQADQSIQKQFLPQDNPSPAKVHAPSSVPLSRRWTRVAAASACLAPSPRAPSDKHWTRSRVNASARSHTRAPHRKCSMKSSARAAAVASCCAIKDWPCTTWTLASANAHSSKRDAVRIKCWMSSGACARTRPPLPRHLPPSSLSASSRFVELGRHSILARAPASAPLLRRAAATSFSSSTRTPVSAGACGCWPW